jgi:hypothetical protein
MAPLHPAQDSAAAVEFNYDSPLNGANPDTLVSPLCVIMVLIRGDLGMCKWNVQSWICLLRQDLELIES